MIYRRKFSYMAWGVIYMIIGAFFAFFYITMSKNNLFDHILVPLSLYFLYLGARHILEKISVDSRFMRSMFTKIELRKIESIQEISSLHYRNLPDYYFWKTPFIGTTFALYLEVDGRLKWIKDIRSFNDYEKLYEELEKKTGLEVKRNIRSWEKQSNLIPQKN